MFIMISRSLKCRHRLTGKSRVIFCVLDTPRPLWPVEAQALQSAVSVYRGGILVNYAITKSDTLFYENKIKILLQNCNIAGSCRILQDHAMQP